MLDVGKALRARSGIPGFLHVAPLTSTSLEPPRAAGGEEAEEEKDEDEDERRKGHH